MKTIWFSDREGNLFSKGFQLYKIRNEPIGGVVIETGETLQSEG